MTFGMSSLRCGDPRVRLAIAAGGGPMYVGDDMHLYCPRCSCGMSQDVFEPNQIAEWCADGGTCVCHKEDDSE